jgi:hypothetical protein
MERRQFSIVGIDELDDQWTFSSNDRARAEDMLQTMKEDFCLAYMIENGSDRAGNAASFLPEIQ